MSEDDEILQVFLEESREGLEQLELDLVALEARPRDPDLLAQIYRSVHSIKGTCGFLGFAHLETLTHRGEDVLSALRAGELGFDMLIATALLRLIDEIRSSLDAIERTGEDTTEPDPALVAALLALVPDRAEVASPGSELGPANGPPAQVARASEAEPEAPAPDLRSALHESSIRVDVGVLDTLMDLAGELVLVRGRLGALAAEEASGELVDCYRQLRRVSAELLEGVRQARLQPVGIVLRKFPRIARDLAASLGRQVRVELTGEDVGVDRAVNEALADALVHLVRNAVDHGLEAPGERAAAGKDPTGRLTIAAAHDGGRVTVEVADDGRGIDPEAVVARALAAGLIAREAAEALDDAGKLELIFLPGLSTKTGVTSVSGRGVGMDAVRAELSRVGGNVEVLAEPGRGTRFRIDVPLTLAIVPCVVVHCAGQRYCIPQAGVAEVISLAGDELAAAVSRIGGASLYRTRGGLVPLVDLAETFGVGSAATAAGGPGAATEELTAVIVETESRRFGIVVDAVEEPIEAVAKPLPRSLRTARLFSGVTIMSDGRAVLITELEALAAHIGLRAEPVAEEPAAASPVVAEAEQLLVARGTGGRRLAVPMASVWRLERVARDRLQRGENLEVLEYGDGLLPIVRLDAAPEASEAAGRSPEESHLDVIVCASSSGRLGLAVESIEDVVGGELVVAATPGRTGLARLEHDLGVAELLDVEAFAPVAELVR